MWFAPTIQDRIKNCSRIQTNQCCGSKYIEFGSGYGGLNAKKNNFRERPFLLKTSFLKYKENMALDEIFSQLSLWRVILYVFNLTPFASYLSYNYLCGSKSTKVLNTDPIWIRIHNTETDQVYILIPRYFWGPLH